MPPLRFRAAPPRRLHYDRWSRSLSPLPTLPSTSHPHNLNMSSTWFITGCSAGFGKELALALLARNQQVVATARRPESIADLAAKGAITFAWDVTQPLEVLQEKAKVIDSKTGGIDILVNNAGLIVPGTFEETGPADDKFGFDTNVWGTVNTTRAFLPLLRARRSGTIVNLSSLAGVTGHAGCGLYNMTKWAVEGFSEALSLEVALFNIRVLIVEPGYFRTSFIGSDPKFVGPIEDYHPITKALQQGLAAYAGKQPGDPTKGASLIIDTVLGEGLAQGKTFPLRLTLGPDAVAALEEARKKDLASLEEWREASSSTNFDDL